MQTYQYKALDNNGQNQIGSIQAETQAAAIISIQSLGLTPVTIDPNKSNSSDNSSIFNTRKVPHKDVYNFFRLLSSLLTAGVSLSKSLEILNRETTNPNTKLKWAEVNNDVIGGKSLAEALSRHPQTFPPVYIAMVKAGELGGFLDVVLAQIASFMASERELKSKVTTALIYPAVIAFVATAVVIFLLTWFIPKFSVIFDDLGVELPAITLFIKFVSHMITDWGIIVALAIVGCIIAFKKYIQTETGKRKVDALQLKAPAVGKAASKFALVRFCTMLGTLTAADVPLIASLRVAKQAIGNQILADTLDNAIENVQQGKSLAASLALTPQLFPPSATEMIAVAEESGKLDEELIRIGTEQEQELDKQLKILVSLAEPLLLIIMALVVGTIVIGMLLPMFNLWDQIG